MVSVKHERTVQLAAHVEPELADRLRAAADADARSVSALLRLAALNHLQSPTHATTAVGAAAVSEDPPIRAERRVEF